jgi:hypothetical protein
MGYIPASLSLSLSLSLSATSDVIFEISSRSVLFFRAPRQVRFPRLRAEIWLSLPCSLTTNRYTNNRDIIIIVNRVM